MTLRRKPRPTPDVAKILPRLHPSTRRPLPIDDTPAQQANRLPPLTDGGYLDFVRGFPCCACAQRAPSEPHHWGPARGMSKKVDDLRTVPLCNGCHHAWHKSGELPGWHGEAESLMLRTQVALLVMWIRGHERRRTA